MNGIGIVGLGIYEPETIITKDTICKENDISMEKLERIGLNELHVSKDKEFPSDMGVISAKMAIKDAGISPDEIDMVITTNTFMSKYNLWADYGYVQNALGIHNAFAIRINQGCSAQITACEIAVNKLKADKDARYVLIVSAETWKAPYINRYTDAKSCLYGDGSSAIVVGRNSKKEFVDFALFTDGKYANDYFQKGNSLLYPPSEDDYKNKMYSFSPKTTCNESLKTPELKKAFWDRLLEVQYSLIDKILNRNNLTSKDINNIVMYNVQKESIEQLANHYNKHLCDTSYHIASNHGHMGTTDIGFNLYKMLHDGSINKDGYILLVSCGGGFSWTVSLVKIKK